MFVSNDAHPDWTRLSIDVPDSPGLLRTITWVLNGRCAACLREMGLTNLVVLTTAPVVVLPARPGMGMRVQNASLTTTEDGTAQDVFWLTTWVGKKVRCEPTETRPPRACRLLFAAHAPPPAWPVCAADGQAGAAAGRARGGLCGGLRTQGRRADGEDGVFTFA